MNESRHTYINVWHHTYEWVRAYHHVTHISMSHTFLCHAHFYEMKSHVHECVMWKNVCGMTHSLAWRHITMSHTFLWHDVSHSYVWCDSFICITMSHTFLWHDVSFAWMSHVIDVCVTWRIHMCDVCRSYGTSKGFELLNSAVVILFFPIPTE